MHSQSIIPSPQVSHSTLAVQEFCEDCPDQKKVVMRNGKYRDNTSLPGAVEELAGDNIYQGLRDGFRVRS